MGCVNALGDTFPERNTLEDYNCLKHLVINCLCHPLARRISLHLCHNKNQSVNYSTH